jgi:hypothetical protein
MKVYKKGRTTKQNLDKEKQKITQNLSSLSLFTFVHVITIHLLCSQKWLLSYAHYVKKIYKV